MIVGIHQPNFFPWIGYFHKIANSDSFVFLDDAQIQKKGGSYVNRSEILIQDQNKWLTAPIERKSGFLEINNIKFNNINWREKILKTIELNYKNSLFFNETFNFFEELINYQTNLLSEYNINAITKISEILNIQTKFFNASEMNINSTSTQRLIDIVKKLDGNIYLSGLGGEKYQNEDLFKKNNIELRYNEINNIIKFQKDLGQKNKLSIIDSLFNIGKNKIKDLLSP